MRRISVIAIFFLCALTLCGTAAYAQVRSEDVIKFDKKVHDFGDVLESDGPLTCTFVATNVSDKPLSIYEVVPSCGCTDVKWSREPFRPGETSAIATTFKNEDGPYPFNKFLTVYVSGLDKPVILKLRGVVHSKKKSLSELYGAHRFGDLGMKETDIKIGNMEQGESKSEELTVANLGNKPLNVTFKDLSPNFSVSVAPNPVPAGKTAKMTLTARSDRSLWGTNHYYATPVVNGTSYAAGISAWTVTKENFGSWSEEQKKNGSQPVFDQSTFTFGTVQAGNAVIAAFSFVNRGKDVFRCYKTDSDSPSATASPVPDTAPGKRSSFTVKIDTSGLPKGETVIMLTLITNSPSRPLINLFVTGIVR